MKLLQVPRLFIKPSKERLLLRFAPEKHFCNSLILLGVIARLDRAIQKLFMDHPVKPDDDNLLSLCVSFLYYRRQPVDDSQ